MCTSGIEGHQILLWEGGGVWRREHVIKYCGVALLAWVTPLWWNLEANYETPQNWHQSLSSNCSTYCLRTQWYKGQVVCCDLGWVLIFWCLFCTSDNLNSDGSDIKIIKYVLFLDRRPRGVLRKWIRISNNDVFYGGELGPITMNQKEVRRAVWPQNNKIMISTEEYFV